ncbi:MAG: nicotinate-nucleotide adenylyltransferase [Thermoguttaceae bacterium]|nr:nicotinate-nucleotide adenylyltransferase [Thermoguttaceae bacterium]MDW8078805.1 nicotinate-nucleotide adenylyltransferase [Thermoguttaceae bacterium]
MRLGVFGGTFDPVHWGHLLLAECCREQANLDEVWFIPASTPPHKRQRRLTDARFRVEMLELAVAGHPKFRVSKMEIERGGVSYTIDTLRALRQDYPDAQLFLILGADSIEELHTWRDAKEICQVALPLVARRPGHEIRAAPEFVEQIGGERWQAILAAAVEMPLVEISSSDIRRRVSAGKSIRYRVPRSVEEYIYAHGLYKETS